MIKKEELEALVHELTQIDDGKDQLNAGEARRVLSNIINAQAKARFNSQRGIGDKIMEAAGVVEEQLRGFDLGQNGGTGDAVGNAETEAGTANASTAQTPQAPSSTPPITSTSDSGSDNIQ